MSHLPNSLARLVRLSTNSEVASMLAACRTTSPPSESDAHEVVIGRASRQPPHSHRPSPSEFDTRLLAELLSHLPNLRTFKMGGDVALKAVFAFPALAPISGAAPPGFFAQLHEVAIPEDAPNARTYAEKNISVAVPSTSTWQSAAPGGSSAVLLASIMKLEVPEITAAVDVALGYGGRVVAFFGGCLDAFREFGIVFYRHSPIDVHVLTISWTAAHSLVNCGEMALALRAGLSACTSLKHLTLAIFLGSNASATLEDQWRANLVLLTAATRRSTLESFTLVVNVHVDDTLPNHLDRFRTLPWGDVRNLMLLGRTGQALSFRFKVVGAPPDISEDIESSLTLGFCHGPYAVERSRELSFAAFTQRIATPPPLSITTNVLLCDICIQEECLRPEDVSTLGDEAVLVGCDCICATGPLSPLYPS